MTEDVRYGVWSRHVKASPYDGTGFRVVPDGPVIRAEPMKVFDTLEAAEEWRVGR